MRTGTSNWGNVFKVSKDILLIDVEAMTHRWILFSEFMPFQKKKLNYEGQCASLLSRASRDRRMDQCHRVPHLTWGVPAVQQQDWKLMLPDTAYYAGIVTK